MSINWKKFNRKTHYWGSIICAVPIVIVIATGILLMLKKEFDWLQPPTIRGEGKAPTVNFEAILKTAQSIPDAGIRSWEDIDRLDIRPAKGVIKIRSKNQWEIQVDQQSLKVLHLAYRRSDFIESIHDGSYFHEAAKLAVFLPSAIILFILWLSGLYLFIKTLTSKKKSKQRQLLSNRA